MQSSSADFSAMCQSDVIHDIFYLDIFLELSFALASDIMVKI